MSEHSHVVSPTVGCRSALGLVATQFAAAADDPTLRAAALDLVASLDLIDDAPLERLRVAYGLSPFERDLVALLGLPEEHETFCLLAAVAHPRGESRLTLESTARVLALDTVGRGHLRHALTVGPLHRHGIVMAEGSSPLPRRSLHLADGIWNAIRGLDHWPSSIRPTVPPPLHSDHLASGVFLAALTNEPRLVLVTAGDGRPPTELAAIVAGTLAHGGTAGVFVDASTSTRDQASLLSIHAIARGAVPVVVGCAESPPLPDHPGTVVVCVVNAVRLHLDDRPVVVFDLGDRALGESIRMWEGLLPELNGGARHLASVLRVDQLRATRAVDDARAAAHAGQSHLSVDSVMRQVRRRTDTDLPPSIHLVHPSASWDELVTTENNDRLLRSIVERVEGQVQVLHDWGFDARGGRGVRAMFAGPPGTGKTLSAEIVASSLGLDLLVVDLSALVSKWLGETEKNISEVFAAADRCQAMLFFDEADAIFGRRTDGGDAQGRWANLETAHLLGRIDAFDGLVVLATNLRGNIDDAFVRRLDVVVEFDEPGPAERRRLWAGHLPERAPYAADVDIDQLAELYGITGGLVRNATMAAAFRAAATGGPIDQLFLIDAVEEEYRKAGRSFPGRPRPRATESDEPFASRHGGT